MFFMYSSDFSTHKIIRAELLSSDKKLKAFNLTSSKRGGFKKRTSEDSTLSRSTQNFSMSFRDMSSGK